MWRGKEEERKGGEKELRQGGVVGSQGLLGVCTNSALTPQRGKTEKGKKKKSTTLIASKISCGNIQCMWQHQQLILMFCGDWDRWDSSSYESLPPRAQAIPIATQSVGRTRQRYPDPPHQICNINPRLQR